MQEDIEQRSISVTFQATKLTARTLQKVLALAFRQIQKARANPKVGRNSLKRIAGKDGSYEQAEVGKDLQEFERIAKKNLVRYNVEKDTSVRPPRWRINFKAGQASALDATFKEYSRLTLKKEQRPSLRDQLNKFKEIAKAAPAKLKNRDHGEQER